MDQISRSNSFSQAPYLSMGFMDKLMFGSSERLFQGDWDPTHDGYPSGTYALGSYWIVSNNGQTWARSFRKGDVLYWKSGWYHLALGRMVPNSEAI